MPPMTPSRVAGGSAQSSLNSGIFFQGEGQSQSLDNSHLSSSLVNTPNTVPGNGYLNMNKTALNSVANSAPSVGASSLVTDANSGLSGGHHLQRSASINGDSNIRFPASPMSYTSNNISISESPAMDGSSVVQRSSHQDQNAQQLQPNQQQQGASSAMSIPASKNASSQHQMGAQIAGSFIQDPNTESHLLKKPKLDIKQDDISQQQVIQQLLQRQDPIQLQGRNQQMQALFQQQQRLKQQQIFQSLPQAQRAHLLQQQQQMQLRQQLQQQMVQPTSAVKRSYDSAVSGVCARRLMQYLYHQRQRPNDNSIAYWKKFVAEYYAPCAKQRWCFPLYSNAGQHAHGVLPQPTTHAWQCGLCGSKSGRRGFEATYEILPRLNEVNFGSGVIDELLFLDLPREMRFSSGVMMLEYTKAVQECVYEQLRVVREGQLRILFTADLKIIHWVFCVRRHEELLTRRSVAPQVNQLVQVALKCQSSIAESGSEGISPQDLQANSNLVLTAGHQLAKSLEPQSLNDLGFSKRYVRTLQIAEVCNSMKDLLDICFDHKIGATESLKQFSQYSTASKLQTQRSQEMEQLAKAQGLPPDQNVVNKLMVLSPGLNNLANNNHMANSGALVGSAQAAPTLTNYPCNLLRQNSMNSSPHTLQRDGPPFNTSNQNLFTRQNSTNSSSPSLQRDGSSFNNQNQNLYMRQNSVNSMNSSPCTLQRDGSPFNTSNQNLFTRQNSTNSSPPSLQQDGSPFNNQNQNLYVRQNSMNSSPHLLQRDGSPFENSNQSASSAAALQGARAALNQGNSPGFSNPYLLSQQQQQHHNNLHQEQPNGFLQQNHSQGSQGNQALQQQMMQQLLQMSNNDGGVQSQSLGGPNVGRNMAKNGLAFEGQTPPTTIGEGSAHAAVNNGLVSRSSSFKTAASNSDSPAAAGGNNGFNQRTSDLQNVAQGIAHDFTDHSFFSSDLVDDDNMDFVWKA